MQMLHRICRHLGLEDQGADHESEATPVTALVEEIEKARVNVEESA